MVHFRGTTAYQVQTKVFIFPLLSFFFLKKTEYALHLHFPGTAQYGFTIGMASSLHAQHVHEERKDVVIRCLA